MKFELFANKKYLIIKLSDTLNLIIPTRTTYVDSLIPKKMLPFTC